MRRIRGRPGGLGDLEEVAEVGTAVLAFVLGCGACWIHPWPVSQGIDGKVWRRLKRCLS